MIVTLIALVGMLSTNEFSWLSADTSHVKAEIPRMMITPEEPVTLMLALIGVATIAAYFVASRTLRRRRQVRPMEYGGAHKDGVTIDQPSRGAA